MKLKDIAVGGRYAAKVSGVIVTVRVVNIRSAFTFGGRACTRIDAVNERTGRRLTIASAARLRRAVEAPSAGRVVPAAGPGAEPDDFPDLPSTPRS